MCVKGCRVIEIENNRRQVSKCEKVFKKVIILWTDNSPSTLPFLTCSKYGRNEEYEKEQHFGFSSFQNEAQFWSRLSLK